MKKMRLLCFSASAVALILAQPVSAGCQPTNYVNNCGFPTNILGGWTVTSGVGTHDAAEGSSTPGSLMVVATSANITFHQCVDVSAVARPVVASFGIDYRDSVANNIETITVSVTDYSDSACTSGNETGNSSNATAGVTSASYSQLGGSYTIGAAAQGVLLRVDAVPFASTITGHFDDAFLGANVVPVKLQSLRID